jgi:hypothetical protein
MGRTPPSPIHRPILRSARGLGCIGIAEIQGAEPRAYCRLRCSRMRRRIFFLRHFQRIFPRFFQARELLFI